MKTLLILRHAKSSWADPGQADYDRPLNKRGRLAAPLMGRTLLERDLLPEVIYSSSAARAQQTTELLTEAGGYNGPVHYEKDLYLAAAETYIEHLQIHADDHARAMVVGHNPGLERLVAVLTDQHVAFPTAALAIVNLSIDNWADLVAGQRGELADLLLPREL